MLTYTIFLVLSSDIHHIRNSRAISHMCKCLSYVRPPRSVSGHTDLLVECLPVLSLRGSSSACSVKLLADCLRLHTMHRGRPSVLPPNREYFRAHHSTKESVYVPLLQAETRSVLDDRIDSLLV